MTDSNFDSKIIDPDENIAALSEAMGEEIKEEANDVLGYAPNPKKKGKRNRPEDDGPVLAVLFNQFIVQ